MRKTDPGIDRLLDHRSQFPALEGSVYMVSHSLGAMPRATEQHVGEFLRLWVDKGIVAWDDWLPAVSAAAGRIARLINAPEGSVIMQPNVSTAMSVLASCLEYSGKRNKVVYSTLEFPTVSYVWQAEARRGARVMVVPGDEDGVGFSVDRFCEAIDEETLIVPLSHVLFRSSFITDVETITRRAHEVGALVVLDMYQSVGVVPVDVTAYGVDFACGGSVKWLCGGPGAGYLYVRPDLVTRFSPRLTGWFGHEAPFAFAMPEQRYAPNIWRYVGGTPTIAAMYQCRAGAELIAQIGAAKIREKSLRQTARLIMRVDAAGFRLNSPRKDMQRGGTVVFDFPGSEAVAKKLNQRRFLCDHRPGAGIRVSPHFYTTDAECDAFMDEVVRLRSG